MNIYSKPAFERRMRRIASAGSGVGGGDAVRAAHGGDDSPSLRVQRRVQLERLQRVSKVRARVTYNLCQRMVTWAASEPSARFEERGGAASDVT
jgi:hypothetical protein